jgi:hypothetical protein
MTENNIRGHCISYAKLVQDLAEQVPAIVLPYSVQHKIFVDSLHQRFRILKALERKTKSADLRALFLNVSFARDEGIESKHSDEAGTSHIALAATGKRPHCTICARGHIPRVSALKEEEGARIGQKTKE